MRVKKRMKGAAQVKPGTPLDQGADAQLDYTLYQQEENARRLREETLRNRLQTRMEEQQRLDKLNRLKIQVRVKQIVWVD